ncbi:MAG: hypothetical protein M3M99_00390, partial [Actinomycetota bacterium]|nr:hypothetical protein [Actinomycetota bacterium]
MVAGIGASGAVVAAGVLGFVVLVGVVSFNVWPQAKHPAAGSVALELPVTGTIAGGGTALQPGPSGALSTSSTAIGPGFPGTAGTTGLDGVGSVTVGNTGVEQTGQT